MVIYFSFLQNMYNLSFTKYIQDLYKIKSMKKYCFYSENDVQIIHFFVQGKCKIMACIN